MTSLIIANVRELVFWEKGVSPSTKTILSSFTVLKLLIWVIRYGSSDAEFQGENFGTKISKISKMELLPFPRKRQYNSKTKGFRLEVC